MGTRIPREIRIEMVYAEAHAAPKRVIAALIAALAVLAFVAVFHDDQAATQLDQGTATSGTTQLRSTPGFHPVTTKLYNHCDRCPTNRGFKCNKYACCPADTPVPCKANTCCPHGKKCTKDGHCYTPGVAPGCIASQPIKCGNGGCCSKPGCHKGGGCTAWGPCPGVVGGCCKTHREPHCETRL